MKLDILKNNWIDIVFEGRNKSYGAYQFRKDNNKTSIIALVIGAAFLVFTLVFPKILSMLPQGSQDDLDTDVKITTVKLPPKPKEEIKNLPPPPPPPPPAPKVDVKKFVKPVVAKAEEVVETPPKNEELVDKKIGTKEIKGNPDAVLTVEPPGDGPPAKKIVEEDKNIYSTAGIELQPSFEGGIEKFYKFVGSNFNPPDQPGLNGRLIVTFIVEKDGSLTDIKVLRDIGYGTKEEAIRVLKKSPRWKPGIQNGKPVRVQYSLPISIQTPD